MDVLKEADLLRRVPMFAKLAPARLRLLAFCSQSLVFEDEEIILTKGDRGESAYVIMAGEVEVLAETVAGEVVATRLGRNALFGELALLANAPRSATLRARGHVEALRISGEHFLKLLAEDSGLALDVLRQVAGKLLKAHRQFEEQEDELQALRADRRPLRHEH